MVKNPNAKRRTAQPQEEKTSLVVGVPSMGHKDIFDEEVGNNQNDHLKELFKIDENIEGKTDLTEKQISIISRVEYLIKVTKDENLKAVLTQFMKLRVSKGRLSRKEYVEATVGAKQQQEGGGFFGRLGAMFGGNNG